MKNSQHLLIKIFNRKLRIKVIIFWLFTELDVATVAFIRGFFAKICEKRLMNATVKPQKITTLVEVLEIVFVRPTPKGILRLSYHFVVIFSY